jgi:hypothetical protein
LQQSYQSWKIDRDITSLYVTKKDSGAIRELCRRKRKIVPTRDVGKPQIAAASRILCLLSATASTGKLQHDPHKSYELLKICDTNKQNWIFLYCCLGKLATYCRLRSAFDGDEGPLSSNKSPRDSANATKALVFTGGMNDNTLLAHCRFSRPNRTKWRTGHFIDKGFEGTNRAAHTTNPS